MDTPEAEYSLQAIKDNLKLFTPEILDQINQEVVKAGHTLVKKKSPRDGPTEKNGEHTLSANKAPEKLRGRVDSFVVETDVHFPTDINLFYDSIRKMIEESSLLAGLYELEGWRQYKYTIKKFKQQYRKVQKLKHSAAKDEAQKELRRLEIQMEHLSYISMGKAWLRKSERTLEKVKGLGAVAYETGLLEQYQNYVQLFIDQIYRRVILGEKIPHTEKIFSIFEPHTEWINKGKAGVVVELGLRVCVMEDQHLFNDNYFSSSTTITFPHFCPQGFKFERPHALRVFRPVEAFVYFKTCKIFIRLACGCNRPGFWAG